MKVDTRLPLYRSPEQERLLGELFVFADEPISLSELARRAGTSLGGVHKEVERLESAGVSVLPLFDSAATRRDLESSLAHARGVVSCSHANELSVRGRGEPLLDADNIGCVSGRWVHAIGCRSAGAAAAGSPLWLLALDTGAVCWIGYTARFVVEWDLTDDAPRPPAPDALPADAPVVGTIAETGEPLPPVVRIAVPEDLDALLAGAPAAARRWRDETRRAFVSCLARGYRVIGFRRDAERRRAHYWLARS